jgi:hypothetical protein
MLYHLSGGEHLIPYRISGAERLRSISSRSSLCFATKIKAAAPAC